MTATILNFPVKSVAMTISELANYLQVDCLGAMTHEHETLTLQMMEHYATLSSDTRRDIWVKTDALMVQIHDTNCFLDRVLEEEYAQQIHTLRHL